MPMGGYWAIRILMISSKNTIREISGIIILPIVHLISRSLMAKSVCSVLSLSLSLIYSPKSAHIVLRIKSLILTSENVLWSPIILISQLSITGHKTAHQCPSHKNRFSPAQSHDLITTARSVRPAWCPNIGASKRTLASIAPQELFSTSMSTNARSPKPTNWQYCKTLDGWQTIAISPGLSARGCGCLRKMRRRVRTNCVHFKNRIMTVLCVLAVRISSTLIRGSV